MSLLTGISIRAFLFSSGSYRKVYKIGRIPHCDNQRRTQVVTDGTVQMKLLRAALTSMSNWTLSERISTYSKNHNYILFYILCVCAQLLFFFGDYMIHWLVSVISTTLEERYPAGFGAVESQYGVGRGREFYYITWTLIGSGLFIPSLHNRIND